MNRNRAVYGILIVIVIILGLASRKFGGYLPEFVKNYSGDVLWALMVYFLVAVMLYKESIMKVFIISIIFSFGVEISQLYQADWINSIRHTLLGGLILGYGFLWSDLICYVIGITIGGIGETLYKKIN